jgi:hypothetical protein
MVTAYLEESQQDRHGWQTPADAFMTEINAYSDIPGIWVQRFIRRQFSGAIHQWLYDAESLTHLLDEGGLPGAHERSFREGELPDLDIIETRPESLFIEVRRT